MEQDYKKQTFDFDGDIAYCRFEKVEAVLKNTVLIFARRYPDSIIVRDAQDDKGYVWGKVNTRKRELVSAEQAASIFGRWRKIQRLLLSLGCSPNLVVL